MVLASLLLLLGRVPFFLPANTLFRLVIVLCWCSILAFGFHLPVVLARNLWLLQRRTSTCTMSLLFLVLIAAVPVQGNLSRPGRLFHNPHSTRFPFNNYIALKNGRHRSVDLAMNLLSDARHPVSFWTSFRVFGETILASAWIFSGFTSIPLDRKSVV